MEVAGIPYFMTNKEWFYYDPDDAERGYKLTDKAPAKARKSYEQFYKAVNSGILEKKD